MAHTNQETDGPSPWLNKSDTSRAIWLTAVMMVVGITTTFKASPEQLASVKAGQKVQSSFMSKGMEATITSITLMP